MRVPVDLRGVNAKVKRLQYPVCDTASVIDSLASFKHFSSLDFNNACLAIKIHPSTRDVTAFCTRKNLYSFNHLPPGIPSGPAVFTQLVQLILGKLLHTEIYAFLDDCCLASKTVEGGIDLLR